MTTMTTSDFTKAEQNDPAGWRLVFLLSRSWSACARLLVVVAALAVLAALALGATAAAVAYLLVQLVQLVPMLELLPPGPSAMAAGGTVTALAGATLGRRAAQARRRTRASPEPPPIRVETSTDEKNEEAEQFSAG